MGRAGGSGGHRIGGGSHTSSGSRAGSSGFKHTSSSSRPSVSNTGTRSSSSNSSGGLGMFGENRNASHSSFSSPPMSRNNMHSPPLPPMYHNVPPPPMQHNVPSPRRHNFFFNRGINYVNTSGVRSKGCLSVILGILVVVIVIVALVKMSTSFTNKSTNNADYYEPAYEYSQVVEDGTYKTTRGTYFEDNLEMELDNSTFIENMQTFEERTNIKPYVYTCQKVNGTIEPTSEDLDILYNKVGLKNSVLLVYQEYEEEYGIWVYVDDNITVEQFPDEYIDKMTNYVVENYEGSMTNAELFSRAFLSCII